MIADEWTGRTGQAWADEWRRTDRAFAPLTERLLARTREFEFASALDVGCGAGELALALARGRPRLEVIGVDVSPQLVDAAAERGGHLSNVKFVCGDAATWRPQPPFAPELLVSRHGVMFFPDPVAAFANLRELAADGAGLLFSCFRGRTLNPVFADIAALLPPPEVPPASDEPGPFAFADLDRVEHLLSGAGWRDFQFEPYDFGMVVGAGDDPLADAEAYFARIGPAARALRGFGEGQREAFFAALRDVLMRHLHDGMVVMRAATWIVSARRG